MEELLYSKAFQYLKTNLWKTLWDNQLFSVKFSDRRVGYCCVLGHGGEYLALGVFIGDEGIQSYLRMANNFVGYPDADDIERKTSQQCLMCSFVKQSQMDRKSQLKARAATKKLGLSSEQTKLLPVFEKFMPYHMPTTKLSEKEYKYLIEAFNACFEVSEKLKIKSTQELNLSDKGELCGKTIPHLILGEDGEYIWRTKKLPKTPNYSYYRAHGYNEILAKKIKDLENNNQIWYCATFCSHKAINDENDIPMFPLMQVLVDEETEQILNMTVCDGNPPYHITFPNKLLDTMLEIGKPLEIIVCDLKSYALYEDLLEEIGVEINYVPQVQAINRIKLQLRNFI